MGLVRQAKTLADKVVVSIFVNPTQFAPHEDLNRYPRQEAKDAELLAQTGADLLFLPSVETMYPEGATTRIHLDGPALGLETEFRPHFFSGVATVVSKLFHLVAPDIALFGEKDYQQLAVIRAMVKDLDFDLEILGVPTVRDETGLALSSRNAYLTEDEIKKARKLNTILLEAGSQVRSGLSVTAAQDQAKSALLAQGFGPIDYVAIRSHDLHAFEPDQAGRILAAAWLGKTRLIDNLPI